MSERCRCGHLNETCTRPEGDTAEPGRAVQDGLDVTNAEAVKDRLHNDPVARFFYTLGENEHRRAIDRIAEHLRRSEAVQDGLDPERLLAACARVGLELMPMQGRAIAREYDRAALPSKPVHGEVDRL